MIKSKEYTLRLRSELAKALIENNSIKTTMYKAKMAISYTERIISKVKRMRKEKVAEFNIIRYIRSRLKLNNLNQVNYFYKQLLNLSVLYEDRKGGFISKRKTNVVRKGDNSPIYLVYLI